MELAKRQTREGDAPTVGDGDDDTDIDQFVRVGAAWFLSQTLLDVSFIDDELLHRLQQECAFEPGELISLKIFSFPTFSLGLGLASL